MGAFTNAKNPGSHNRHCFSTYQAVPVLSSTVEELYQVYDGPSPSLINAWLQNEPRRWRERSGRSLEGEEDEVISLHFWFPE